MTTPRPIPAHSAADRVSATDPQVDAAMRVYDEALNPDERREVFRSVYRDVLTWKRTRDARHLGMLAESLIGMVVHETNQPGLREAIRNRPRTVEEAGGLADFAEVYALLRDEASS